MQTLDTTISQRNTRCGFLVAALFILALTGCTSNNDASDLSSTDWQATTLTQDGKTTDLTAEKSRLRLLRNGSFRWTKGVGTERRTIEGSYELSAGDQVVLNLKDEAEGSKTHVGELTLSKDTEGKATKLVFRDSLGTIEFLPPPPPVVKPKETKPKPMPESKE